MTAPVQGELNSDGWCVVMNDEEQWSIWPVAKPVPAGWRPIGVSGPREACLTHIEQHWVDMRPLCIRPASPGEPTAPSADPGATERHG